MKDKKTVYLVQASAVFGENKKTAYLPYAAGCLASYAFRDEKIKEAYEFGRFVFLREDIDEAIDSMEEPYLVGFSCYIWNTEYNFAFAKRLKERYPDVITVFGGHNVMPGGATLAQNRFVDIVIHGEGERPFRELLLSLSNGGSLADIGNISYRNGEEILTTKSVPAGEIADYPSPYLDGWFDSIVNDPQIKSSAIWETNRGCPNRCAFCDWSLLKSKVRMFPMQRLKAEIAWFAERKMEFIYCADANFGLFERDEQIAELLLDSKRKTGYPVMFRTNFTKNKEETVFEISRKLIESRMGKAPTLSFQSLSEPVLKNIGRSNLQRDHFQKLMAKYSEAKVPVLSELILGLPGETYESFSDGLCTLLECNQHTAISVYPCELLTNSRMGSKEYIERFDLRSVRVPFTQYHIKLNPADVKEYSDVVVSTSTMDAKDWKKSYIFSVTVQMFHNLGLLRAFAIYLYHEKKTAYKSFYEALIKWLDNGEGIASSVFSDIKRLTDDVANGKGSFSVTYGEDELLEWPFEEYGFIRLLKNSELFYSEIIPFLSSFGIEEDIFEQLLIYQKEILKRPDRDSLDLELAYDFYGYFKRIFTDQYKPLEKRHNRIVVKDKKVGSWDEWSIDRVWFGRRSDAQLYTGKNNTVRSEIK